MLRVTSNWTGRTMEGLSAGLPMYMQPYNQIDLNGDYEITKHLMVTGSVMWVIYGLMLMAWPLIVANTVSLLFTAIILTCKLRYG